MADIVPYTLNSPELPESAGADLPAGTYQAVHFQFAAPLLDRFLASVDHWFANRDDVILVASGTTAQGFGFLVLEWEECEVDPLFLTVLEIDPDVEDYAIYNRSEEV